MKLMTAVLAFAVAATPAFAQHRDGGHSGGRTQHESRAQTHEQGHFRGDGGRHATPEARGHFDGRHFDEGFRHDNFGREHSFRIDNRVRYGSGWRFYYGGAWFGYDAYPFGWGINDPVYIDQDGDVYYMYDPYYPGARVRLNIVL